MKTTFSTQCKIEAANAERGECCGISFLYGLFAFSRNASGGLVLSTPSAELAGTIRKKLIDYGLTESQLEIERVKSSYHLSVTDKDALERIFLDFGYSGLEPNMRINDANFACELCVSAFVAGAFISGGSVTDPQRGYHLEFSTHKAKLFDDFVELLEKTPFAPKISSRGYTKILYFKDSAQIEDILTYIGAQDATLDIINMKIERELSNQVNRQVNCVSANIDKAVASALRDGELIKYIMSAKGIDYLPPELRETALLRLQNPEISLEELGALTAERVGKSGVSHRLRKIRALAQSIKEETQNAR